MARVKLFINQIERAIISANIDKIGERGIDQARIVIPANVDALSNDSIYYVQDMTDESSLDFLTNFGESFMDESGFEHHGELFDQLLEGVYHFSLNYELEDSNPLFNNPLVVSGSNITYPDGYIGKCIKVTGNSYLTMTSNLGSTSGNTISCWMKIPNTGDGATYKTLVYSDANNSPIVIQTSTGELGTIVGGVFYTSGFDTDTLANGWHNLVVTFNYPATETKFYINGVLVGTANQRCIENATRLGGTGSGQAFGEIDEFKTWQRVLALSEIEDLAEETTEELIPFEHSDGKYLGSKAIYLNGAKFIKYSSKSIKDLKILNSVRNKEYVGYWKFGYIDTLKESSGKENNWVEQSGTIDYSDNGFPFITSINDPTTLKCTDSSGTDFYPDEQFAVMFLAEISGSTGVQISKQNNSTSAGWRIERVTGDYIKFAIYNGTTEWSVTSSNSYVQAGNESFNFVYVSYDGSGNQNGMKIYLNGVETVGATSSLSGNFTNSNNFRINGYDNGTNKTSLNINNLFFQKKLLLQEELNIIERIPGRLSNGDFTILTWIKPDIMSENGVIAASNRYNAAASSIEGWCLYFDNTNQRVVFEISDGTNQITINSANGSILDDFSTWYHIAVRHDSTNDLLYLYINGIEVSNTSTASLTSYGMNNCGIWIGSGAWDYGSFRFTGSIDNIRVYNNMLSVSQVKRLHDIRNPRSNMKFRGVVSKAQKNLPTKELIVHSLGKQLGDIEVVGQVFNNSSPEYIIQKLINEYTNLVAHLHGSPSGIILEKYVADSKLIDIINDLSAISSKTFHVDTLGQFHLHDNVYSVTDIKFIHGENCVITQTNVDDTEIMNNLVVVGENKRYITSEKISTTAGVKTYSLLYPAINLKLTHPWNDAPATANALEDQLINNVKSPETDYEVDTLGKTLYLNFDPGNDKMLVEYEFERPIYVELEKEDSEKRYGSKGKRFIMPWIKSREDGIRFTQTMLERYKNITPSLKVIIPFLGTALEEDDIVEIVFNVKPNLNGKYIIKSLKTFYPEGRMELYLGEFTFSSYELQKQITKKIHDLEHSVTTSKDIQEVRSPVLSLAMSEKVTKTQARTQAESMGMGDTADATALTQATYNATNYNQSIYTY